MKCHSTVSDSGDSLPQKNDNEAHSVTTKSVASSHRRFAPNKRINAELSEPLNSIATIEYGGGSCDPYFVFRSDLQNQLELLDEFLADYLRTGYETVRTLISF